MIVELEDGNTYQIVSASDNSRGHRCNIAFVDKWINQEIIDNIIKPCLLYSNEKESIVYF